MRQSIGLIPEECCVMIRNIFLILAGLNSCQSQLPGAEHTSSIKSSVSACAKTYVLSRKLYFTTSAGSAEISIGCSNQLNEENSEDIKIVEKGYFNTFRGPPNWASGVVNPIPYGSLTSSRDELSKIARGKITLIIPPRTEGGRTSPFWHRYILSWAERPEYSPTYGLGPDKVAIESAVVETLTNDTVIKIKNVDRQAIAFQATYSGRVRPVHITPGKNLSKLETGRCEFIRKRNFIRKIRGSNEEYNFLKYDGPFHFEFSQDSDGLFSARCFAEFDGYSSEFTKGLIRFFANSAPMWKFENDSYITEDYYDDIANQTIFAFTPRDGQFMGIDVKSVDPRGRLTWVTLNKNPLGIRPVYNVINPKGSCAAVALTQTLLSVIDQRTFDLANGNGKSAYLMPKESNRFKLNGTIYRDEKCEVRADDIYLSYAGSVPLGTELTPQDTIRYIKYDGYSIQKISVEPLNAGWGPFAEGETTDILTHY